jgi:hypothetical protein
MEVFLRNEKVPFDNKKDYDLRYFYVHDGRGYYTSGVAAQIMTLLLRDIQLERFNFPLWYDAVRGTKNPVVKGFIAEQILLNKIAMNGLPSVSPHLTRMDASPFTFRPV